MENVRHTGRLGTLIHGNGAMHRLFPSSVIKGPALKSGDPLRSGYGTSKEERRSRMCAWFSGAPPAKVGAATRHTLVNAWYASPCSVTFGRPTTGPRQQTRTREK